MNTNNLVKGFPTWSLVLSLIAATAGLALLTSGMGIAGDNPVKVQSPLEVVSSSQVTSNGVSTDMVVFNDRQSFTVPAATYPGDSYEIELVMENKSGVEQIRRLFLSGPPGFRFSNATEATATNLTVGQTGARSFIYTVASGSFSDTKNRLKVRVEVLPQVVPGWYSIDIDTEPLSTTTNFN